MTTIAITIILKSSWHTVGNDVHIVPKS